MENISSKATGRSKYDGKLAWQDDALCAQVDPEIFSPKVGDKHTAKIAKSICAKCEVKTECLEYALENNVRDGIWGGLTPEERKALKRQRATANAKLGARAVGFYQ